MTDPSQNPSSEARELTLVGKVEDRIVFADSETKLQNVLGTYLAPLLLKLGSEHVKVRNKVISICQHINTRTKNQNVRLPVAALLKQFKEQPTGQLIRYFDILYIEQGLKLLSKPERVELIPILSNAISKNGTPASSQGAGYFHIFLRCLVNFNFPPKGSQEDDALRSQLELTDEDAQHLSSWFGKLLLLKLAVQGAENGPDSHAGLSSTDYAFLTQANKPETWDIASGSGLNLTETKIIVVKALSSGMFKESEKLIPTLVASADPNSKIADSAEELLKRTVPNVSLEEGDFVDQLYGLYFGVSSSNQTATTLIGAARTPVRLKILSLLSKTGSSASRPQNIIRLTESDLAYGTDTQKHDRETTKLRTAVISFLNFVAQKATPSDLQTVSRSVVPTLKNFIEYELSSDASSNNSNVRGRSYEVIGVLLGADSQTLLESDLFYLRWLFNSLSHESDKNVLVSIDQALSATLKCLYKSSDDDTRTSLRTLLADNMQKESRNVRNLRFASVRFANRLLPYSDVVARWIDMIGVGQSTADNHEVLEESRKGLDPYWYQLLDPFRDSYEQKISESSEIGSRYALPDFSQLVRYVFVDQKRSINNSYMLALAVSFGRQTLLLEALLAEGLPFDTKVEWDRKLDVAIAEDGSTRNAIRNYLITASTEPKGLEAVKLLWDAAYQGTIKDDITGKAECAKVLCELCTFSPDGLTSEVAKNFRGLESSVWSNDVAVRSNTSQSYGILASHPAANLQDLETSISSLLNTLRGWDSAIGSAANRVHGCMIALAHCLSRLHYRQEKPELVDATIRQFVPLLFELQDGTHDSLLLEGSYQAIGQLALFFTITPEIIGNNTKVKSLVEKLSKKGRDGNEKAILSLGYVSMTMEEDSEDIRTIIENMRSFHEIRQVESQFMVGESFSCLAFGWESNCLISKLDIAGPVPQGPARARLGKELLTQVLEDCKTTKPALKRASIIWLLSFIQFCGHHTEIQGRLAEFQAAFKRCLSDREELVQEAAARGLGLVYENGDRSLKDDLVRDLVGSFSNNRSNLSGTVSEDTQLFEPGALPTGDGSVSTYKDIMSLASEVGDSSLVYRFMSLASNNAIWASRAAFGRFGLSNVLSDSSVDGYLANNPKLYPKLYRYRFDPNSNVRKSMNDIWSALIKDSAKAIDEHFDLIMEDLLLSILGREWRVRQASCNALSDLVQGRKIEQIGGYLDKIWNVSFKVLDDIKESVRTAAAGLARTLTAILLRNLEGSDRQGAASKQLESVLPFLLSTAGIESKAEEVQARSVKTLLDIIKKAQVETLRPFVPDLIERLLALLSSLGQEKLDYIRLNASNFKVSESQIDDLRLASVRSSPIMEAIERCLDTLDEEYMAKVITRIRNAMKAAVGMPTKVGISRIIVSLCVRKLILFRPHANQVLNLVQRHVLDRNETVSSAYAAAIGYTSRASSEEALLGTAAFVKSLYFDSADEKQRLIAAEIVQAIAKQATDQFQGVAAAYLPLVFIAQQDDVEHVAELFSEIWTGSTGGNRAASLYLTEIVSMATSHMDSKQWSIKHACATAVAEAVHAAAAMKDEMTEAEGQILWPALELSLGIKTWEKKAKVLQGLEMFVAKGGKHWRSHADVAKNIQKIALREAKRRNDEYRPHALTTLGKIASSEDMADLRKDVVEICEQCLATSGSGEDGAGSARGVEPAAGGTDAARIWETPGQRIAAAAARAMFSCMTPHCRDLHSKESLTRTLVHILSLVLDAIRSSSTNHVRLTVFTALREFLDAAVHVEGYAGGVLSPLVPPSQDSECIVALMFGPGDAAMTESVRQARAEALVAFAKVLCICTSAPASLVKEKITELITLEKAVPVRNYLMQAKGILEEAR